MFTIKIGNVMALNGLMILIQHWDRQIHPSFISLLWVIKIHHYHYYYHYYFYYYYHHHYYYHHYYYYYYCNIYILLYIYTIIYILLYTIIYYMYIGCRSPWFSDVRRGDPLPIFSSCHRLQIPRLRLGTTTEHGDMLKASFRPSHRTILKSEHGNLK